MSECFNPKNHFDFQGTQSNPTTLFSKTLNAEMSEWSNEHDWKSCDVKASAGSNPVLCAITKLYEPQVRTFLFV